MLTSPYVVRGVGMQFLVGEIKPNPFRHIDRYPIKAEKVTALRESLRTTGFWDNVVGRVRDGSPEIAYGHHRLAALKAEYGAKEKVELIIRDLSDEQMLQIMARENMEEWGTSAQVEHETVRAVVEAYAEGRIELERLRVSDDTRFAPSFVPGVRDEHRDERPYSVISVARFLGWMKPGGGAQEKVGQALAALQLVEEGILAESDFDGLSGTQAAAVVEEARRVRAQREQAARRAEEEAEQARKRAEQAERDRAAARERADREAEQRAERERVEAERVRKAREAQAVKDREEGRKQATKVGRGVSGAIKGGKIGTRGARAESHRHVAPEARAKGLPNAEAFMRRLASDLNKVLDPDYDPRVDRR